MTISQHLTNAHLYPQFVVSKIANTPDGKVTKIPCDPHGRPASHKDPENWLPLDLAYAVLASLPAYYRLGISITREIHKFFIDLDKCIINGVPTPYAVKTLKRFASCFVEKSQSGTGYHIVGSYTGDAPPHRNKNSEHQAEVYTHDRFMMFGSEQQGDWEFDATAEFHAYVSEDFNDSTGGAVPPPPPSAYIEDDDVIARCRSKQRSQKVFSANGVGVDFDDVFNANESVLARTYPPIGQGEPYDRSSADLALVNMLACETLDKDQILRIMWRSELVRAKWSEHGTYLPTTINKGLNGVGRTSTSNQLPQHNTSPDNSQGLVDEMSQEYHGCYYVYDSDRIYSIPHARALTEKGFNVAYNDLIKTKNPYALFIKSAEICGHTVDSLGFRPNLPHGEIIEREGEKSINIYKAINVKKQQGNVEPFLNLIKANYPNERDQRIIISYMAALVQNPGIKSMWCPVLQGVQGCGKSFIMDFMAHAVGEKYTYRARGDDFESRFNGPFFGKLILLIEDPILKDGKLEERLKQLVTQKSLAFESKRVDAKMGDHYANLVVTLNDFDNFKKQEGSRRYAVLKSILQTEEEKILAGLTDDYFVWLANWRDREGYETVSYFLHNHIPDPEFDFSKNCCTAPNTSTTAEVIEDCRSPAELLIQEAIDSGRVGFRGGFISGTMLTRLLIETRSKHLMPDCLRSKILRSLGFILHPQLIKGRASRPVLPDGNQPAFFIKIGHTTTHITNKEAIMKAYEDAQK